MEALLKLTVNTSTRHALEFCHHSHSLSIVFTLSDEFHLTIHHRQQPHDHLIVVLFPAPLGPISPTSSPDFTDRATFLIISVLLPDIYYDACYENKAIPQQSLHESLAFLYG